MPRLSRMRTFIKLFFLATIATAGVTAGACGGKSKAAEEPTPSGVAGGSADGTQDTVCANGGTPAGSPDAQTAACGATYKGCCYADAAAACAAAGCAENCVQAESMPVQVSCPESTEQPK